MYNVAWDKTAELLNSNEIKGRKVEKSSRRSKPGRLDCYNLRGSLFVQVHGSTHSKITLTKY